MRFRLRSLLLMLTAITVLIGGITSYYSWLHRWEIHPTDFRLHIADSNDIVHSELELADDHFDLSNLDFPCNCFLGFSYLASSNNGNMKWGSSGVKLVLNTDENDELIIEEFEKEWVNELSKNPTRVEDRIRMKLSEITTSDSKLAIEVETILEDLHGHRKQSRSNTLTMSNK